jgi:hypothetical protein
MENSNDNVNKKRIWKISDRISKLQAQTVYAIVHAT